MRIRVEIGTPDQRRQIEDEMEYLRGIARVCDILGDVAEVIVPKDFDSEVRKQSGVEDYQGNRGYHLVMAKIIQRSDGIAIVISPYLFTEGFDTQIRIGVYLHEATHVENAKLFPARSGESPAEAVYFENLYYIFDDYAAVRSALETCDELFAEPSARFVDHHREAYAGFVEALNDTSAIHSLVRAIVRFRFRQTDIAHFQEEVQPVFDRMAKSLLYAAAYKGSCMSILDLSADICCCPLVTEQGTALVSFMEGKYRIGHYDLGDGLDIMKAYVRDFGYVFEDHKQGIYCRVVGHGFPSP